MAFGDPLQWIVIAVVVVALFLWGPQKIPELARAVGRARREFDQASKEGNAGVPGRIPEPSLNSPAPQMSGDQMLIETARQLGIATEGKTREQISQEILSRAKPKT